MSSVPSTLTPYPGQAGGEAIVHGLRIVPTGATAPSASTTAPATTISSPAAAATSVGGGAGGGAEDTVAIGSNATFVVDEALVASLLEAIGHQHQQLVDQLTELSDVVATEAVMGVCNLSEAAATLEDTFRRIDLLHAKVEYLNAYVAQPVAAAVKKVHEPKDLKGKALSVLKSFSFMKAATNKISSKEEDEEAVWSRIPPFVLIGEPAVNATTGNNGGHGADGSGPSNSVGTTAESIVSDLVGGSSSASATAPYGSPYPTANGGGGASSSSSPTFTFGANLSLLQPMTSSFAASTQQQQNQNAAASSASSAEANSSAPPSYFKKDYTAAAAAASNSSAAAPAPIHSRNPAEFKAEVLAQSAYYFEQSTANK